MLFLQEAVGGAAFGLACGWVTYLLLKSVEDYKVEVLLTLALATGGYALAEQLHVSAPIFMVTAGLIVGNHGRQFGMSETTRVRLDVFWELIDEALNAILFIHIGLEVVVIRIEASQIALGLFAILAVLAGRLLSVGLPVGLMGLGGRYRQGTISLLTWGGLRGGLSIAMALSLPAGLEKDIILPVTYCVVLFSILVQGLTFKPSLKYLLKLPRLLAHTQPHMTLGIVPFLDVAVLMGCRRPTLLRSLSWNVHPNPLHRRCLGGSLCWLLPLRRFFSSTSVGPGFTTTSWSTR